MNHFDQVVRCIVEASDAGSFPVDGVASFKKAVTQSSKAHLLGRNAREKLEVDMWLTFSASVMNAEVLSSLNVTLLTKTYLVGNSVTAADFAVFIALSKVACAELRNIARWSNHIRSLHPSSSSASYSVRSSTLVPVPVMDGTVDAAASKTAAAADAIPPTNRAPAAAAAPATSAAAGAATAATVAPKADKAEDSAAGLDPTRLDIRCGLVVKCWNHPDSDKLLCEEVDLGGGDVRQIASGIRAFYSADQLLGRKVVVLANLKERSIAGFKSQGMVLCAVSKDHSVVRLLEAPESAGPGDRVLFPGFPADSVPATPAQMVKKKILEGLAPGLRTDASGAAHWENSPFVMGSAGGVCAAPGVADAVVS